VALDFAYYHGVRLVSIHRSITNSINDLGVHVADPEAWVFRWLRFYHTICRYFAIVCY